MNISRMFTVLTVILAVAATISMAACEGGLFDRDSSEVPEDANDVTFERNENGDAPEPMPTERQESREREHTSEATRDRAALVALYHATGGPNWGNNEGWLSDDPIGHWWGVFTSNGRVTKLHLFQNQLTGELPPELGDLTQLEYLYLWENDLVGELPSQIGNLSILRELNIRGNSLSGEIPPEIGKLAELSHLNLNSNRLSGEIPSELGNLKNLSTIDLWNNQLSGQIPAELGNLKNLHTLSLASNQLSGEIPPEMGNAEFINYLDLEDNQLSGEIPPELGEARELRVLWLSGNQLRGEMPFELANRRHLDLSGSDSGGCVPKGLRNVRDDGPPSEPVTEVVGRTSETATLSVKESERAHIQMPISYEWHRSDEGDSGPYNLIESNVTNRQYVDQDLDPDTTYFYAANACNACGCSDFAYPAIGVITESGGRVDLPSIPTGFRGTKVDVIGPDQAEVNWRSSPGATFYEVYQGSQDGSEWELDAEVSAPATEYRDYYPNTALGGFDTTSYRVRACNKGGCSDFTNTATVR